MILKLKNFFKSIIGKKLFQLRNDSYEYRSNGYVIKSNSYNTLEKGFDSIFNKRIYDFRCDTSTPFIIDGGANIGLATLYWKQIYPNSEIIAFEPSKEIYPILEKNILDNNIKGVRLINKAISNTNGITSFMSEKNRPYSGSLRIEKTLKDTYEVETVKLSSYLDRKVDLLKLDIEGAEKFVFPEITDSLFNIEHLFIEYHSFVNERQYLSEILNKLEMMGFRYYIEQEVSRQNPFDFSKSSLNQDMQLNIWAKKIIN